MALVESQRSERVQPRRSERRQVHRAGQLGHEQGEWCPEGLPREAEISGGALAFQAVQSGCPSGTSDHVWVLVPAAGSSVGLEGSKPGARGRPRPDPAIKGRCRLLRPLMRRGRLLEPESQTPCQYSQGWGDGHRRREEGAAELGGWPQGQVSWSRASRVILFHVTFADGTFAPPHSHLGAPHGQEAAVAGSARGRDCPGCPGPCCPAHTGPGLGPAPPRPRPAKTPPRQDPAPPRHRPRGGRRGAGRAPTCSYVGTSRRAGRTLAEHLPAGVSRGGRRQAWLRRRRRRRRLVGLVQGRWRPCGAAAGLRLGGGRARAPHGPYAQHLGPPRT